MTTTRLFFGLLLTMLGVFAIVDGFTDAPLPDLWNAFGTSSLLSLGLALIFGRDR
jgi:hypothetical protein